MTIYAFVHPDSGDIVAFKDESMAERIATGLGLEPEHAVHTVEPMDNVEAWHYAGSEIGEENDG